MTCSNDYIQKPRLLTLNQCSSPTPGMAKRRQTFSPLINFPPGQIPLIDHSPPIHQTWTQPPNPSQRSATEGQHKVMGTAQELGPMCHLRPTPCGSVHTHYPFVSAKGFLFKPLKA